jgi:hypothetical protein
MLDVNLLHLQVDIMEEGMQQLKEEEEVVPQMFAW